MQSQQHSSLKRSWPDLAAVWRWHFYAGLFCIPFVIWLSLTGSLYVFKPQIEAWIDAPYDALDSTSPRSQPSSWIATALAAVPGSKLDALELPQSDRAAVRVLVRRKGDLVRVYVHPATLQVLKVINENDRLMKQVSFLHGELGIGDRGSLLVETAACWAIIMLLTGTFLWWPRSASDLRGVLIPRLGSGPRLFWRDLHAVTGIWVCLFAMFLLLTGLPWAKNWGAYLKEIRYVTGTMDGQQDWSTGRSSERKVMLEADAPSHEGHDMSGAMAPMDGMQMQMETPIDTLVPAVEALQLAPPVLITPPGQKSKTWTAKSDAQNRTLRANVDFDPHTLAIVRRKDFNQRHPIDRVIGIGISAHEGHLFGWANQTISLLAAFGLLTLSVSAIVLWLKRRPPGQLGAPQPRALARFSPGLLAIVLVLAIAFPMFGASLLVMMILERVVLRRIAPVRIWLGLPA